MASRTLAIVLFAVVASAQQAELQQGQSLLAQKKFSEAEAALAPLVVKYPQHAGAWYLLAFAQHNQDKFDKALAAYQRAFANPRLAPVARYNSACIHARRGESDAALKQLEQAVSAGFKDWGLLKTDKDLVSVRNHARFKALIPVFLKGADAFVEKVRVLHELHGEAANDQFGWVARPMGDLDGDGVTDFATSAPTKALRGPGAGRVYVYSSKTGKLLFTRDGIPGAGLGTSLSSVGDIDGDGTPDVLAGAPGTGTALVFSGRGGATLQTFRSDEPRDGFGIKVCGLGDLDGDGCPDVLIGAWNSNANGKGAGRAYAFSGKTGKSLFVLDGPSAGAQFGSAADAVTSSGKGLLVIGAMSEAKQGRAHVYKLDGAQAVPFFTIDPDKTSRHLGQYFVSIVGDVDGDGTPDVYASDFGNHANGPATGRVFLHSGKTGKRMRVLTGTKAGEGFGTSPSWAGDVNGDGCDDLVIGAWRYSEVAKSGGRCTVFSGKDGTVLTTYTSKQVNDTLGFDACGIGAVDGDGKTDFLLTAAWSEFQGPKTGRVWIVAGGN